MSASMPPSSRRMVQLALENDLILNTGELSPTGVDMLAGIPLLCGLTRRLAVEAGHEVPAVIPHAGETWQSLKRGTHYHVLGVGNTQRDDDEDYALRVYYCCPESGACFDRAVKGFVATFRKIML